MSERSEAVYNTLTEPKTAAEVAWALGIHRRQATTCLGGLVRSGRVISVQFQGRGRKGEASCKYQRVVITRSASCDMSAWYAAAMRWIKEGMYTKENWA
jgi:predicted ArsR family transcriptional regulator